MSDAPVPVPVRVLVARTLSYRGRAETFASLPALFQGVCGVLRDCGALSGVYDTLAAVKQRILKQGQPLSLDDVVLVASAHNARSPADPLVLSEPSVVLSVRGTSEQVAYYRELVHNLKLPERPLLTLNQDGLLEMLATLLHPRHFTTTERGELLGLVFPQQEGLNLLRVLDTLYKATFSRTIRKEFCEPKILYPVPEGSFRLRIDQHRTVHFSQTASVFLQHLLFRLYRTPDLAPVVDGDVRLKARIQDGLRLLSGALHDAAVLPQKRLEIDAILKDRQREATELEELEEL